MSSEKRSKTRTLIIKNDNDPIVCSDSVTLSDNVLKRIHQDTGNKSHVVPDEEYDKEETKYWENRANCLGNRLKHIDDIYQEESERAEKIFKTTSYSKVVDPSVCKTMVDRILDCYKLNPDEPLKCSQVVSEFTSTIQAAADEALKH